MRFGRRSALAFTLFLLSQTLLAQELSKNFLVVTDRTSLSALRFDPDTGAFNDKFTKDILVYAEGVAFGPDQNLYVSDAICRCIHRFNGSTGRYIEQFVRPGTTPLGIPEALTFGPDGNLYVADISSSAVHRYETTTGLFIDTFVRPGSGGLKNPIGLAFGPDLNLYVTSGTPTNVNPNEVLEPQILKYAGDTGEFAGVFVPSRSGGLDSPFDILFGPDGFMYVSAVLIHSVLRYDAKTGAFVDVFVKPGSGGLQRPTGLAFGPDGNLYVCSAIGGNIGVLRYDGKSGAFIDTFIASGPGGISGPTDILFYTFDNRIAAGSQPVVASDASGNRLVAWSQDGRIFGQHYDGAGVARAPSFEISRDVAAAAGEAFTLPAATATGDGYLVAWQREISSTTSLGIGARAVSNSGALGSAVRLDAPANASDTEPAVAGLPAGRTALVWTRRTAGESVIMGRLLRSLGEPETAEIAVSDGADAIEEHPTIAADGSGEIIVAWQGSPANRATSRIAAVSMTATISQSNPSVFLFSKVTPYVVDPGMPRPARTPSLGANKSGKFGLSWASSDPQGTLSEIKFVPVTSNGVGGIPITINIDKATPARNPSTTVGPSGDTTVVWQYDSREGKGIFGRGLDLKGLLANFEFVVTGELDETEELQKPSASSGPSKVTVVTSKKVGTGQTVVSREQSKSVMSTKAPARRRAVGN